MAYWLILKWQTEGDAICVQGESSNSLLYCIKHEKAVQQGDRNTHTKYSFLVSCIGFVELELIGLHCIEAERGYSSGEKTEILWNYFKLSFGLVMWIFCKYESCYTCVCMPAVVLESLCFFFQQLEKLAAIRTKTSWPHTVLFLRHTVQWVGSHRSQAKLSVDILVSFSLSKRCMSCSIQSLVSHVINGLVGLPVLCLVGLPVMDLELFDRWVYLSMTPLLQMMMMLQPLPHLQHPQQVGTHKNPYHFLIHSSSPYSLRVVAIEHSL